MIVTFRDMNQYRVIIGDETHTVHLRAPRFVYDRLMDGPTFIAEYVNGTATDGSEDGWRLIDEHAAPVDGTLYSDLQIEGDE